MRKVKQRVILDRPAIFRSPDYLTAVRKIPCVVCGAQGFTQAAHSNQLRFGKGMGIKASDATAMALCGPHGHGAGCHAIHDQEGRQSKVDSWQFEYRNICKTVTALARDGRLIGDFNAIDTDLSHIPDAERQAMYFIAAIERGTLKVET